MAYSQSLPTNRAVLFANLSQALSGGEKFPELFDSVADISPQCYQQDLNTLAASIREEPGKPLLQHVNESPLFWDWEKRYFKFGLASLKIAEVFARICDYYVLVGQASRQLYWWVVGIWTFFAALCAYVVAPLLQVGELSASTWLGGVGVFLLLMLMGWGVSGRALRTWVTPDSGLWRLAARTGACRALVANRSVYYYLLNLGLCIQNGMTLNKSLKVAAKSEPIIWLRQRYLGIAADVANGLPVSKAFIASGILSQTRMTAVPRDESGKPAKLWEPGITDVVRESFADQLHFIARFVPMILVLVLILLMVIATMWWT